MIAHLVSRVANDGQERARIGSLQPAYAIQQLPLSSVLWQLRRRLAVDRAYAIQQLPLSSVLWQLRRRLAVDRSDGRRIAAVSLRRRRRTPAHPKRQTSSLLGHGSVPPREGPAEFLRRRRA